MIIDIPHAVNSNRAILFLVCRNSFTVKMLHGSYMAYVVFGFLATLFPFTEPHLPLSWPMCLERVAKAGCMKLCKINHKSHSSSHQITMMDTATFAGKTWIEFCCLLLAWVLKDNHLQLLWLLSKPKKGATWEELSQI
jgi:hypothetical protein